MTKTDRILFLVKPNTLYIHFSRFYIYFYNFYIFILLFTPLLYIVHSIDVLFSLQMNAIKITTTATTTKLLFC